MSRSPDNDTDRGVRPWAIADPEAALEKLREFRDLQETARKYPFGDAPLEIVTAITHLVPLIEDIALSLGEEHRVKTTGGWPFTVRVTSRLISIVEQRDDYERIFGPIGPTLAANRLHPWVWSAAANLWDDGHYIAAVDAAVKKVELQTQQTLRASKRRSGADLFAQAFSLDDPGPDTPRLRFSDIDRDEDQETWNSAHMGAQYLGMGCAKGIRNPLAHPTEDTSEIEEDEKQEALEQLAALSVLARWVDACEVIRADE